MSRDKQIEEMARDLCPFEEYDTCKQCDTELDIDDEPCIYKIMAKQAVVKGYRKASEVAMEVIDEIEQNFEIGYGGVLEFRKLLAELKKKYTESEKN